MWTLLPFGIVVIFVAGILLAAALAKEESQEGNTGESYLKQGQPYINVDEHGGSAGRSSGPPHRFEV